MTRRALLIALSAGSAALRARETGEPSLERQVFDAVNFQRVAKDREPLEWNAALAEAARQHTERMASLGFFGHEDPELGGVGDRLTRAGIRWLHCGENIFRERGWDDPVAIAIVEWMYSAGHRANILNEDFTLTGVGISQDSEERIYVAQTFCRMMPPGTVVMPQ